jgi:hypothetical protein
VISSSPRVAVPDTGPGAVAEVSCDVQAPMLPGSVVAHWRMAEPSGDFCFPPDQMLSVLLVIQ